MYLEKKTIERNVLELKIRVSKAGYPTEVLFYCTASTKY